MAVVMKSQLSEEVCQAFLTSGLSFEDYMRAQKDYNQPTFWNVLCFLMEIAYTLVCVIDREVRRVGT